jgi:hypothetical protein
MTPTLTFALLLILPLLCAACVLLGAWIQYRAGRRESPLPPLPQVRSEPKDAPPGNEEELPKPRRHRL